MVAPNSETCYNLGKMQVVTDLHVHSRYARAVSQQMVLPVISQWCQTKGINVVSTGDWTHPLWFKELSTQLEEVKEGLYALKGEVGDTRERVPDTRAAERALTGRETRGRTHDPLFLLSNELEVLYSQGGKVRKVHLLIFAPNLAVVGKINNELTRLGKNLFSDGRPKLGMSAHDLAQIAFEADERCLVIPAHAWTPWFGIFGSMSGFDSLEECFSDLTKYIYGIETGLSSDPGMNWQIADLANRAILSFSDAHSPAKLGRELTVFELPEVNYESIRQAVIGNGNETRIVKRESSDVTSIVTDERETSPSIAYTLEFYPEEGKYHYTGHRNCGVKYTPEETNKLGTICPVCRRPLTVGVMHRVQQLSHEFKIENVSEAWPSGLKFQIDDNGVKWIENPAGNRPRYAMMVPLLEILAEGLESTVSSQKVFNEYKKLTDEFGNETSVLLRTKPQDLERISGRKIRESIEKVRRGDIFVDPGFDGEFGKVKIWSEEKAETFDSAQGKQVDEEEQMGLF